MKKILLLLLVTIQVTFAQDKPVRMGIVGMTHDHVRQILHTIKHEGVEIVGFAEPDKALAMKYLAEYKLPESLWYASLDEMIEKAKPEAVCDFRSIIEHLETVQKCAPKGVHVMVEKPLAVNFETAKQMEALAKKHKIQLLTNYETTWYASNHEAYKMINERNEIGEIRKVVIHDGHSGPKEIGVSKTFLDWLADPVKNGGGAIIDFGCYGTDIMAWIMKGERPLSVTAVTQTIKPETYPKVDDEATIIVTYPKAQGIFQASWNWPFDRKDAEFYGKNGYIIADRTQQMRVRKGDRNAPPEEKVEIKPLAYPLNDPFSYFAAVVRGKVKSENDLGSLKINMVAMEILDAAVKSAKAKKTIELK
ncbi:Gfo/Idh/MocA family protein [Emticicia fluvialis]|uniref:Gfo/Idh/MocA family protein n=1 Tax=Emticicia fluvialis TaxID=2974474 RepID=UPI002166131D|nr:Gfo/Idh/MocA family oxidoreductase [Emticicia fluvialis]